MKPDFLQECIAIGQRVSPNALIEFVYSSGYYDGLVAAFRIGTQADNPLLVDQLTAHVEAAEKKSYRGDLNQHQEFRGNCDAAGFGPDND